MQFMLPLVEHLWSSNFCASIGDTKCNTYMQQASKRIKDYKKRWSYVKAFHD